MFFIPSSRWRIIVLPLLIWAAVLLPTLHLHPQQGHDHEGQTHQHAIVHADFWAGAASAHDHGSQHENAAHGDSEASFAQIDIAALAALTVGAALPKPEKSPPFLFVVPTVAAPAHAPVSSFSKREHPPPAIEILFGLTSPRSPPSLA